MNCLPNSNLTYCSMSFPEQTIYTFTSTLSSRFPFGIPNWLVLAILCVITAIFCYLIIGEEGKK